MADARRFELDELINRPGTYDNPHTEVVIVVDDSATIDAELFADADDGEWLLVSDDLPVDETRRDEMLERLQRRARAAGGAEPGLDAGEEDEDDPGEEDDFRAAGFDEPAAYEDDDY